MSSIIMEHPTVDPLLNNNHSKFGSERDTKYEAELVVLKAIPT